MFSSGQLFFALFFVLIFTIGMIYAYRKDIAKNRAYFKGTYKVIIAILVVYFTYLFLTKMIH